MRGNVPGLYWIIHTLNVSDDTETDKCCTRSKMGQERKLSRKEIIVIC